MLSKTSLSIDIFSCLDIFSSCFFIESLDIRLNEKLIQAIDKEFCLKAGINLLDMVTFTLKKSHAYFYT